MSEIALVFDTLQYSKEAIKAGFTEEQAEFQAEGIAKVINEHVASKRDIQDLKNYIEYVNKDLKIWIGGVLAVGISTLGILITILHR
jgi:hypothetical protein